MHSIKSLCLTLLFISGVTKITNTERDKNEIRLKRKGRSIVVEEETDEAWKTATAHKNENPECRNCRMKDKSVIFFGSRNQFNSTYNIVNERMHLCK